MSEEYMTASEAAEYLGVERRTISRLIKAGDLPAIVNPFDRRYRFVKREDVERLARLKRKKP